MSVYINTEFSENRLYLESLSVQYPNIRAAAAEIINLQAILNLPKGTEHFLSDIHGEYEAFRHILNNASGVIREKVDFLFSDVLSLRKRSELCTLIYYPDEKLKELCENKKNLKKFYNVTLQRLLLVLRLVSSKYTKSKIRKALPSEYAYILEELLNVSSTESNRSNYYTNIIKSIIDIGQAQPFIKEICNTVKRLIVDRLHIVGDIFDRGTRPDIVLDDLINYHDVDIQWGNHDILWMGAASGSRTCIANALNNAFAYGNLDTIETGYGINLRPLALFAEETYRNRDVSCFIPKVIKNCGVYDTPLLMAEMHKAIAIILFKLEGHIIRLNPSFNMEDRMLLNKINYTDGTINLNGKTYTLRDCDFPTINPSDPYKLTFEEEQVMERLKMAFQQSEKLQRHINFLFSKGGLYKCCNNNLLFHGCIPMNKDGTLTDFKINGKLLHGKELLDAIEQIVRIGYYATPGSEEQRNGRNYMWFLWGGKNSPLFGRSKMCTFEHMLIDAAETHEEPRNAYYDIYNDESACINILKEFGLGGLHSHIINGHIPVRKIKGENPLKAGGRLIVIDGGFCRVYQNKTGTAGYTLVYNSYGMRIIEHETFCGITNAIKGNKDILSTSTVFDTPENRILVSETDDGDKIRETIKGLKILLEAYKSGLLKERYQSNHIKLGKL